MSIADELLREYLTDGRWIADLSGWFDGGYSCDFCEAPVIPAKQKWRDRPAVPEHAKHREDCWVARVIAHLATVEP